MGKYEQLSKDILKNIGGKENINGLTHCITRLRFNLKDESKANDAVLEKMDGIVTVIHAGGQYQIVIGNHVPNVYTDFCEVAGIALESQGDNEDKPKGLFNKFIDIISSCFTPILGPMCAAGIVKGLNAFLAFILGATYKSSGTYLVLNAIGDTVFYFMPILLGYTASKKFKINSVIGMLLGGAICYPTIQNSVLSAGKALGSFSIMGKYYTEFLGIPLVSMNYTSSVIPILVIIAFAAQVQKVARKIIPELIQNMFVPFFVLLVSIPVGLLIIGPVVTIGSNVIADGIMALYKFSPIVFGLVMGFSWQILVIFGMHMAFTPLVLNNIATRGFDIIFPGSFGCSSAISGVLFAMYLKMKNKKKKATSVPALVSALLGITEPAIYGFVLPEKKTFIYSCIGGGISGAVFSALGGKRYMMGAIGILGVVNHISPDGNPIGMYYALICATVAMIVGFSLTFLLWKDKSETIETVNNETKLTKKEEIGAPIEGIVKALSEVKDVAFAKGTLGKGIVIEPTKGRVVAPFDGIVMTLFPTGHAVGLISDNGCEVLIHIGLDTVKLEGKYFKTHIKQGEKVKKGQLLVTFDKENIEKAGYCLDTPVIVTNTSDYLDVIGIQKNQVSTQDTLITALL